MLNKKISPLSRLFFAVITAGIFTVNFNSGSISLLQAKEQIGAAQPPVQINNLAKQLNETFNSVSNSVIPTVVSINVKIEPKQSSRNFRQEMPDFEDFFGFSPFGDGGSTPFNPGPVEGSGSGVIISSDGYIVTNNHVVEDAVEIKVTTYDKKTYKAKLIGNDPATDLAVIQIEASGLPTAYFANINDVKIGEMVLAVGNPLGLNSTITQGIISAISRGSLNLGGRSGSKQNIENYIQTDAAINPGNSGGGLFDLTGSLVGINTAIASRSGSFIGYGFAVPIDLVKAVSEDLIEDGKIDRGYIGVMFEPVNEAMAKAVGLNKITGTVVQEVKKRSPAEKAGVETGDIILEVDGREVSSANQLQGLVFTKKSGDNITLTILRDGKKINKTITLEPLDDNSFAFNSKVDKGNLKFDVDEDAYEAKIPSIGITVEKINSDKKNDLGVDYGVIVNKVEKGSDGEQNGLTPGTIILKADKQNVNSPADLHKVLKNKKSGDAVLLQVKNRGVNRMLAIIIN